MIVNASKSKPNKHTDNFSCSSNSRRPSSGLRSLSLSLLSSLSLSLSLLLSLGNLHSSFEPRTDDTTQKASPICDPTDKSYISKLGQEHFTHMSIMSSIWQPNSSSRIRTGLNNGGRSKSDGNGDLMASVVSA